MKSRYFRLGTLIFLIGILAISPSAAQEPVLREESIISPEFIYQVVVDQLNLGPRYPGSPGALLFHDYVEDYISKLPNYQLERQEFVHEGVDIVNFFVSHKLVQTYPKYLITAHYDSRAKATQDPNNPDLPVPGANDAASGVAGIFEMLRILNDSSYTDIGFILFDAEDQGRDSGGYGIEGWNWIIGSSYFANQMTQAQIDEVETFILLDMIGNDDLQLPRERNSDPELKDAIWAHAATLGYNETFVNDFGPALIDDHVPFKNIGMRVIDIIDFYGYDEWHTLNDNIDAISEHSIAVVTDVVLDYIASEEGLEFSNQNTSGTDVSSDTLTTPTFDYSSTSSSESADVIFFTSYLMLPVLLLKTRKSEK